MTSLRRASSSWPMPSICSGVRCAAGLGRPDFFRAGRCGRGVALVTDRRGLMPCGLVDAWSVATWCGAVGEIVRRSGARVIAVVLSVLAGGRWEEVDPSVDVAPGFLELDVAGARNGVDAGLHGQLVAGFDDGDVARAQVAHGALTHGDDAAEADAHPASARHEDAGLFAGVEDRGATVGLDGEVGGEEGDLAALSGLDHGGAEALGVQAVGDAGAGPVGLGGVEQAGGTAGPGLALAPVGHSASSWARSRTP